MSLIPRGPRLFGVTLVVAAMVLGPTAVRAEDQAFDLFKEVQRQVLRYSFYTVFDDVSIDIDDDGGVTLTGSVTGDHKKKALERRVAKVAGVTRVRNDLELLPASSHDDQLRYRIARAIYGSPHFWRHGARANPPIHIVVNRGHVTLTGVVSSEVDRTLARSLAGQFNAYSVTSELRLPAEIAEELERL